MLYILHKMLARESGHFFVFADLFILCRGLVPTIKLQEEPQQGIIFAF